MQLRALEIKNPEVEDYYYVNYMKRLLKKGMTNNQNQLVTPAPKEPRRNRNNSEREEKSDGKKDGTESKEKKPWSEGSLGKPVCSSGTTGVLLQLVSYFTIKIFKFSVKFVDGNL